MKSNLIKRQDAIDIVSFECGKWKGLAKEITKQINALPSAQPEIHFDEWCTDCKEYDHEKHCCPRFNKVIRETVEEAKEAQPKTGKWIEVHGFCTPGGDPVWACSECGKGIHVYGVEHGSYGRDVADGQWKACPNCGAKMEGEEHD